MSELEKNPQGQIEELDINELETSFFDTDIEDIKNTGVESESYADPNLYSPSIEDEKAVNREYKAFIRVIKNPRRTPSNGKKNIVSKHVVFIANPNNPDSKIMVDDISHIERNNIITNAFFACRNSKSHTLQTIGKQNFSRKAYNWALVKIEKDEQHPELVGQIRAFRFASQVDEIFNKALENDPANEIHAKLYSDPIKGYKFVLTINEKEVDSKDGDGKMLMTNYTDSRFVDQPSPLQFEGISEDWFKSKEGQKQMLQHLLDNSPILENYEAKMWDKETEDLIIEAVRKLVDDPNLFDEIYFKTYKKSYYAEDNGRVSKPVSTDNDEIPANVEEETFVEKKVETPKAKKSDVKTDDNVVNVEDIDDITLED